MDTTVSKYDSFVDCLILTKTMASLPDLLREVWFSLLKKDYETVDYYMDSHLDDPDLPDWLRAYDNANNKEFGREVAIEDFIGEVLTGE